MFVLWRLPVYRGPTVLESVVPRNVSHDAAAFKYPRLKYDDGTDEIAPHLDLLHRFRYILIDDVEDGGANATSRAERELFDEAVECECGGKLFHV